MRDYIANRFKTYELIASALGPPTGPPLLPANITAGSATTQDNDEYEDRDDEEQPSASNDEANNVEPNEVEQTGDSKKKYVNPICLF